MRRRDLTLAGGAAIVALAALFLLEGAGPRADVPPARLRPGVGTVTALDVSFGGGRAGRIADGFVAAGRRSPWCTGRPDRMVRNGPNKYALGRCGTRRRHPSGPALPAPSTRLLRESAFASLIAADTCVTAWCAAQARRRRGSWALVAGATGVRPRTVRPCERYENIDFSTDEPIAEDRLPGVIPAGRQVLWRYASRGGGWVMAHWPRGGRYAWAFIPRSCVADPPAWGEVALWADRERAHGRHRPTSGRRFRVVRRALPCASRLRCHAVDAQRQLG